MGFAWDCGHTLDAEHAAALLHQHGIWLAGIDSIGDKFIELDVFGTEPCSTPKVIPESTSPTKLLPV
jgi:hypothetical protein